jgi:hypothetical protein
MPEKETLRRARADKRAGKSPSTQAGEFVREEIHHVREGKHGAASTKQAIAIGLSKARKAGVRLPPKGGKRAARSTPRRAKPSVRRSRATLAALKRKPRAAASHRALSRQARTAARRRRTAGSARRRRAVA